MAKKKERPFDKLYAELEDIKDARGDLMNTVLFSKNGNWSVIIEIENPVQQYCTDSALYYGYSDILSNIIQTLGEVIVCKNRMFFADRVTSMSFPMI